MCLIRGQQGHAWTARSSLCSCFICNFQVVLPHNWCLVINWSPLNPVSPAIRSNGRRSTKYSCSCLPARVGSYDFILVIVLFLKCPHFSFNQTADSFHCSIPASLFCRIFNLLLIKGVFFRLTCHSSDY